MGAWLSRNHNLFPSTSVQLFNLIDVSTYIDVTHCKAAILSSWSCWASNFSATIGPSKIEKERDNQSNERSSISQNKQDIQNRLESYRLKLEENIFPELEKLEEEYLLINLDKSKIESKLKELEAEIGPVKYIAKLISDFGGPEVNSESAVRMVILILIFVFDPLAILLVVAASSTFKDAKGSSESKDLIELRNKVLLDLEMHLADGKPAESFIEKYKI